MNFFTELDTTFPISYLNIYIMVYNLCSSHFTKEAPRRILIMIIYAFIKFQTNSNHSNISSLENNASDIEHNGLKMALLYSMKKLINKTFD